MQLMCILNNYKGSAGPEQQPTGVDPLLYPPPPSCGADKLQLSPSQTA